MKKDINFKPRTIYAERIRHFRRLRSLTQEELAFRTGLSKEHINKIENDKTTPPLDTLYNIAAALNVEAFQFLTDLHDDCYKEMSEDQIAVIEMIYEADTKIVNAIKILLEEAAKNT